MKNSSLYLVVLLFLFSPIGAETQGDVFGTGNSVFEIEFVTIGNPGNITDTAGDPNPAGSVPYTYRIGKFEISEQMVEKANALGGLGIPLLGQGPDQPATFTWDNAARFVNWLNTSEGLDPAYKFDSQGDFQVWQPEDPGYDPENLYRNARAEYVLPDVHEWYKAAYYDPVAEVYFLYPTGSNQPPVSVESGTLPNTAVIGPVADKPADIMQAGGLSPYGTMAQGGNLVEWHETEPDLVNDGDLGRIFRGGSWNGGALGTASVFRRAGGAINIGDGSITFRVVHFPEPASLVLLGLGFLGALKMERRTGRRRIDCATID
jgi:sulfatase modifying factor 1